MMASFTKNLGLWETKFSKLLKKGLIISGKIWLFGLALIIIILADWSCKKKSTGENPVQWEIGETSTYDISGSGELTIQDPTTGYSFLFPDGGSGILELGKITSGPEATLDGEMIYVDYDGSENIQIIIPDSESKYEMVLGYGTATGCLDDSIDSDSRWISVARANSIEGNILFDLPMPFEKYLKDSQRSSHLGFSHYLVTSIPPGTSDESKLLAIRTQAGILIQHYLDSLPAAIQAAATAEVAGRLSPTYYADGNYYIGFTRRIIGNTTTPMIGLVPTATPNNIAHEIGHYMSHVLVGDVIYLQIEDLAPDDPHGLRDLHKERKTITEDIAYFSEYFFTGRVGQSWDPTEPRAIFGGANPITTDFPSFEGFGCALLANLQRTSSTIIDVVSVKKTNIPVVAASFKDIFGIIALGATNINQLRANVQTYLAGKSQADKLPVILHRIGWRYSCNARIVDQDGNPMANVWTKVVAKVAGSSDYYNPKTSTGSDGKVFLDCFGGDKCYLRVFHDNDSIDVLLPSIAWSLPTDKIIEFGDVVVNTNPVDLSGFTKMNLGARVFSTWQDQDGSTFNYGHEFGLYGTFLLDGSFSGNTFHGEGEFTNLNGDIEIAEATVTFDPIAKRITSFEYIYTKIDDWNGQSLISTETISGSGINIPMSLYYEDAAAEFELNGPSACNQISILEARYVESLNYWRELKSYSCNEDSQIYIGFYN